MSEYVTVTFPEFSTTKSKLTTKNPLESFVEIETKNLKYFYGSWIKYKHILSKKVESGGFLSEIKDEIAYLRSPRKTERTEIIIDQHIFFCKETNENLKSVIEIDKTLKLIKKYIGRVN